MKITKINTKRVKIPLVEPFHISLGVITHAEQILVEIETDEGLVGIGEGSAAVLISGETLESIEAGIRIMEKEIIGCDPMDIEKIYWIMDRAIAHCPSAKTAIDIACYDLIGKITNMPLYKVLGGNSNTFETDMTVGINDPAYMAEKARTHVAEGFDTIKTKVGTTVEADVARVKAIRDAVGPDVKIRLDANQGWTPKEAIAVINKLADYDIELIEQPVPYHDFDGLAFVTAHSPIPIMSDESVFNSKDAMRAVKMHAVDLINIKLMKCGGIREALKINAIAEAAGVECMLGCMAEESNIGVTAAASLGAAMKNITRADLDAHLTLTDVAVKGGVIMENGKTMILPEKPGLGLEK
ncbi:hydrophobic dipeptide epimerase [Lacrimispora indolis]|nr:hydrophobic dipeptide epimerase [[Clostridium] methoxybenzovorans]